VNRLLNTLQGSCLETADTTSLMISLSFPVCWRLLYAFSNDMGSGWANEQAIMGD